MDPEGFKELGAVLVMMLLYGGLVFSNVRKASRGAMK
jgi:hypothetical protein